MKKVLGILLVVFILTGCGASGSKNTGSAQEVAKQQKVTETLLDNQPTPIDINYSLERYNLIKRAYWVNGQREKANTLQCEVEKPLGYIVLFTDNGSVVGRFIVDGKVTSLNSFLTPSIDYEIRKYYQGEGSSVYEIELADVDGSYGENDNGIFFFTTDGKYIEWTGAYLYSDIPFTVNDPILIIEGE